jgi:hypothetical protein
VKVWWSRGCLGLLMLLDPDSGGGHLKVMRDGRLMAVDVTADGDGLAPCRQRAAPSGG